MKKTLLAAAVSITLSTIAIESASAAVLADGLYDMVINNTPYVGDSVGYDFGSDGAWNSSFTFACLPGTKGCASQALYDDFTALPVNGKYAGNAGDGVQGTIGIRVEGGNITGTGKFEFDTIEGTAGGNFAQYGSSIGFTGSIDDSGNISLTPNGLLGTFSSPSLVDNRWNVDNFNDLGTGGTNPPNNNTVYDSFSTGSATNAAGSINGAAYDGTSAILVKGGAFGSDWGGFFGASYFEVWNVSFTEVAPVPVPAAAWLFGSGLLGLVGIARRKRVGSS